MKSRTLYKQTLRWLVWGTVGVLAIAAASSPWFTVIAHACQNQVGGC